ncbi:MAG: glycoside hydrolase [Chelatococcus sp.]|nr:MAG: glycoside hydrolase [Chelatococcus sp.]
MTVSDTATLQFLSATIGRRYEPAGLHCWELVRMYQRVVAGRELPPVLIAPERRRELVGMMDLRHSYPGWRQVQEPQDGAVVFMTRHGHEVAKAACHAGIWLSLDGGGILHTDEPHGVVFESVAELTARNWADLSFYVPA